ncbi:4,5:9,10-diseco-3-hydroxy-5,9, 17-trioxoandrosta-1(10),2-diene-4-oate hydrolase [Thalassovita gelatinovora]|uniref:4,5:9,10-diseco-3-hydroxy-5,9, 17-trioxoandrosta-1(10),2-diene-4-oate hydrolase n=1 Tax=Thalassovita gelatinovora TaxID=53501 RepID=A0A0P1F4L2_THAGE|nr:alpha/beta hydrolase [Thalassovita gelatinovora]QIZ79331.1 alpha/beta hydrolase [Thalassovita gelatinovora]CUH62587.1 4,5:9,10-diseco-3-hydroxy-5,9, 17-trioxoandrosta-1(10),2-diene-4-oate hydrolase [Thalassovita gelatinovora]SEQ06933.1 Pimeloyl-ACP methyl ester carboxylesterase [Thalassovita gelatinovora]
MVWIIGLAAFGLFGAIGWLPVKTWLIKRRVEKAIPPRGAFITTSIGQQHYVDRGEGPAIVLIHGLGAQLGNFDMGLIDGLARDHRVIALDRPGMGWSEREDETPANPRAQAAQIVELIDALGLDQPLVVGHSLGGAISLCLALDFPMKTKGLALLAPLTMRGGEVAPPFKGLTVTSHLKRFLLSWTLAIPMSIRNTNMVLDYTFGPETVPKAYSVQGGGLLGLRPVSFRNTCRDFLASARDLKWMNSKYAQLPVPVSVLFARDDRILDPALHGTEFARQNPKISLTLIEGGHMLPVTQPETCESFIRDAEAGLAGIGEQDPSDQGRIG